MACSPNHHLAWYHVKPIFTPCFLPAKRAKKQTIPSTDTYCFTPPRSLPIQGSQTKGLFQRQKSNPHYQMLRFLQASPSSNSVKFSVLLQCLQNTSRRNNPEPLITPPPRVSWQKKTLFFQNLACQKGTLPETNIAPKNGWIGILLSYWGVPSGRVVPFYLWIPFGH